MRGAEQVVTQQGRHANGLHCAALVQDVLPLGGGALKYSAPLGRWAPVRSASAPSLVVIAALAGCTSVEPPREMAQGGAEPASAEPGGPIPLEPIAVDRSCTHAPPMGDLQAYSGSSGRLVASEMGIRVRTCAVWPAKDLRNVIGVIEPELRVPLFGPLKHEAFSAGIGYAVPLVDPDGSNCRGYVSATVVEGVESHPDSSYRQALPLPDARDAWVGPCRPEGG